MSIGPVVRAKEEQTSCMPARFSSTDRKQFELNAPSYLPDHSRHAEPSKHSENVSMGNMLFEVLNSQVLGGNYNCSFQEDVNFAEALSYYPDRASNLTLIQMLEGMTTPREDVEPLDSLYSKLPILQEQKYQPKSLDGQAIQMHKEREALVADLCRDFRHDSDDHCRTNSIASLQTFANHLAVKDSALAQHPSTSESSDPSNTLVTSEHIVEAQDEAQIMHSSPATQLDEGTSSGTHGQNSSTSGKLSENFLDAQPASSDLPSLATDPTCEQSRRGIDAVPERKKRKRSRACKNSEEVESQRMTHIAVERNRRKQMNEHLNVLRTLMPGSYIQRGDQASIIGGAIEFVKELEQVLQSLQIQKQRRQCGDGGFSPRQGSLLGDLILGPEFGFNPTPSDMKYVGESSYEPSKELFAESRSSVADVEVKMVGSDAVVKVLSQKRPGQLLKTLATIQSLHLTIMHLNITTIEHTVLYSFNIKMGAECQLQTVSELAVSIQQIFSMIDTNSVD